MSTDRSILHGTFASLALTAVNVVVSFLQFRMLMNWLPQQIVGLWFLFLSIGGYLIVFDLGVSPTLGREISFCSGNHSLTSSERIEQVGNLIKSCRVVFAVGSVLLIIIGSAVGWVYLGTISPMPLVKDVRIAWIIFVVGTALSLVGEVWLAALYGMGQVATERLVRSVGPVLWLILAAVSLHSGYGLVGLTITWVVQAAVTRMLAKFALQRVNPHIASTGKFDFGLIRRMAAPSLKYAATMLGGILILQTDNLVIASMLGTQEIPGYQAVAKLVTLMMSLSTMLVASSVPFLSQAHARRDIAEIKRLLNRNLRFSLSIMIVLCSFLACFADRIIAFWLGPHHFVGFGIVWVLIAVMILESHHASMATATMATGEIVFVAPALIAGGLNIVASVYLSRQLGLLGVALGTMCAQVVTNNWYVPFYTMRQFGISFREHFSKIILPVGILLVVMLSTGIAARVGLRSLSNLSALIVGAGILGVVGCFVFILVVQSASEREQLSLFLRESKL